LKKVPGLFLQRKNKPGTFFGTFFPFSPFSYGL